MKDVDKVAVGNRIAKIRYEMGYTLEEFGKKLNPPASFANVSRWENGIHLPVKTRLIDIAFFGQISVDELLYGKKETTIDAMALFNQQNDVRQYLSVDVDDVSKDFLIDSGIPDQTIQNVINHATIYVNMSELPEEITVIKNI